MFALFQCDASCGRGVKTRRVLCAGLENGAYREYPDKRCNAAQKPEVQAACFKRPCSTWFTTAWSQVREAKELGEKCRGEGAMGLHLRMLQRKRLRCLGHLGGFLLSCASGRAGAEGTHQTCSIHRPCLMRKAPQLSAPDPYSRTHSSALQEPTFFVPCT